MSRKALVKQLLLASSGYWVLNKTLVKELGLEAAFLLSNLAEAEQMLAGEDGWFYQTISTVEKVTTLSRHKQEVAIDQLKDLGILDTKTKGLPPKRHFRLNYEKIAETIEIATTKLFDENSQIDMRNFNKTNCQKLAPNKELSNKDINNKESNNIYTHDEEKEKESEELREIFQAWIAADIIKHKRLTRAMETKIKSALKDYTVEEIKQAIKNYGYIVNDDGYFFNYKWSLDQFCTITQKDRIGSFLDLEVAKNNYRKDDSSGGYKQDRHTSRARENTQEYSSDRFMREAIRRTEESGINPDELDIDF